MGFSNWVKWWVIGALGVVFGQGCTPQSPKSKPPSDLIEVDSSFTSTSLNQQVLVCTQLSPNDLHRKDLQAWIVQNKANISPKKDAILVGSFRQYPQAWFYTQIINTSQQSQQLVVDEFNRTRCDAFEVFTVHNSEVKRWGGINRTTPFASYPLPFFTYAVPITILPKDTLQLVVHTQRHYGAHEVNLNLSSYETYLGEHIVHFLSKVLQIVIFLICALIMLILGQIFAFKTMTYLGIYLMSVVFIYLNYLGFTDAAFSFRGIGLSAANANAFAIFVSCIAIHPFLIKWMKAVPKNKGSALNMVLTL
ncbi:MAG: hypothetical protein ACK4GN_18835 [Runella sp.]